MAAFVNLIPLASLMMSASALSLGAGQTERALPVQAVTGMKTFCDFQSPVLSSDSDLLAYGIHAAARLQRPTDERYTIFTATGVNSGFLGCDLRIQNLKTGDVRDISGTSGTSVYPAWSPDGQFLAFLSDRGGKAGVWIWEKSSGNTRLASDTPVLISFSSLAWTSDSKRIVTATAFPDGKTIEDVVDQVNDSGLARASAGSSVSPLVYTAQAGTTVNKSAVPCDDNETKLDVALIEVSTGHSERVVRGVDTNFVRMSPDGRSLVFLDYKCIDDRALYKFDLTRVDLNSGAKQVLVSGVTAQFWLSWSPDGRSVVYATSGDNGGFFVISAAGGVPRRLTRQGRISFDTGQAPIWEESGTAIYVQGKRDTTGVLWRIRIADGAIEPVVELPDFNLEGFVRRAFSSDVLPRNLPLYSMLSEKHQHFQSIYRIDTKTHRFARVLGNDDHVIGDAQLSHDGTRLIWRQRDALRPVDLWTAATIVWHPEQLTHLNPELESYALGQTRLIGWHTADGKELRGGLILPSAYHEGQRYPLVVCVYGGAGLSDAIHSYGGSSSCDFNLQLLATRGYAVLYADSWITANGGRPLQEIGQSVLPGVDQAIALGIADPERIGVMGQSYGAYSTLALVTQSTRFKAAVSVDGFSDLLAKYGQMEPDGTPSGVLWAEDSQGNMGGTPWQYRDRYIENSPFFFLDRVQAAVLLIHGTADHTVEPWLGDQTFVGLRRLGKEVTYVKYRNAGHSTNDRSYDDQVDYCNRIIDWFDKYLRIGAGAR